GNNEQKIYQAIMRDFSYEVKNVSQRGSEATAELTVSNRDMEAIYGQFVVSAYQLVIYDAYQPEEERMGEEMLKQKIDEMLLEALTESETELRLAEISVDMTRRGRSWYMNFDHNDLNAIYGGYLSAQEAADNVLGDRSTEALTNLEKAYQSNIDDARHVLRNAVHYMVDDVWNGILCNVVSCINAGTDIKGEEYDIASGMAELDELLKEKEQYDTYIDALDDVNYGHIKNGWRQLTDACDALIQELKEKQPEPVDFDYIPDTTELEDAIHRFVDLVYPE
ncbi:MAG: hypothetical protein ACI4BB_09075, partial [Coprococcus sp.]